MLGYLRSGAVLLAIGLLGGGCGGSSTSGNGTKSLSGGDASAADGAASGSATACSTDADCGVGEIQHEIRSRSDCMCLFGCPYIPLNKTTVSRRQAQHASLCDPRKDANGDPCPIDDCIVPPAPVCVAGECRFASDAAR